MKVYLICPVRKADNEDTAFAQEYVEHLENEGHEVYWPQRDTEQDDPTGVSICLAVKNAIERCDCVDVIWSDKSEGKLWDLSCAFTLEKPVRIVGIVPYEWGKKSYAAVLNNWPWTVHHVLV